MSLSLRQHMWFTERFGKQPTSLSVGLCPVTGETAPAYINKTDSIS